MSIQYPFIPKQAFLFFPKGQEVFRIRREKPYRILFDGCTQLTNYEKQKIEELRKQIQNQKSNHHLTFYSDSVLLRMLQATKYDYEDCIRELKKYKKWEQSILPLNLKPQIQSLLNQGLFYLTGRDVNFRPIIVVNVAKIIELDLKEKIFYELTGYFFQYIVENCMIEGQIETWITIVDLGKMGLFSLGSTVGDTIKFLSNHFRCRLHHSYLVNCPSSMTFLFGMIKKVLSQDQIEKITITEESSLPRQAFLTLFQDEIEKQYGGLHQDFMQYWPIRPVKSASHRAQLIRLASITEYGQMHAQGLLNKTKICKEIIADYEQILSFSMLNRKQCKSQQNTMKSQKIPSNIDLQELVQDEPFVIEKIPISFQIFQIFS